MSATTRSSLSAALHCERIAAAVAALRRDSDGPICAYLYDLAALERHVAAMRAALPERCELFYAAKANPEPPILKTLAPLVDGFEAASGGELAWLSQHQPGRPLLFGGPGKLTEELRQAVCLPDCAVHVESLAELARLGRIAAEEGRTVPVFLRLNIALPDIGGTRLMMGGRPTPFGMDEEVLPQALQCLRLHPQLQLQGFHFHLLSHQLDAQAQLRLVAHYLTCVRRWRREFDLTASIVNAGGGFGVNYLQPAASFDWNAFCAGLPSLLAADDTLRLRFEPGRYLTASCGWYIMEVLDIKRSHGEWFAIGRGGTHHFRTPAAQQHDHPCYVLRGEAPATLENAKVTLVGQLCTPKDILARQQAVTALAVGDCMVFPLAGAYAWNISHQQFLMHPPPLQRFI